MLSYLPVVAPIVAIINGAIAVYASHFKPEERSIKLALLGIAIAFGLVAASATIWSQYSIVQQQNDEKSKQAATRQQLAGYITSATQIMRDLQTPSFDEKQAEAAADRWYEEVSNYMKVLGPDYSARFDNTYGLMSISPNNISGQERTNYFLGVYYRNIRLEQIASEFSRQG